MENKEISKLVDNNDGTHTVLIPIIVPNSALQVGGLELFAKQYGWTEKVKQDDGIEIENPRPALDVAVEAVQSFVANIFKSAYIDAKEKEVRSKAAKEADAILGK